MKREPLVLFPADAPAGEPWRLGRVANGQPRVYVLPLGPDATPAALAAAVVAVARGPITLALPSSACLSATVDAAGLPRQNRRSALLYRLELTLPLAAEDVAADFLPHPRGSTALGIAVAVNIVRPWIAALESAGLTVAAVCPAALLAVDTLRLGDGLLACGHGSAVDLFAIVGGQIERWFTLPAEADDVRLYLPAITGEGPARLVDVPDAVAAAFPAGAERIAGDWYTAATTAATAGRRLRVELSRDGLAPRGRATAARHALVQAGVAAAVFVACCCGAALWRAQAYQQLAEAQVERQRQTYHELFPGRPVPPDVRARLASEARGLAPDAGTPGAGSSALVMLHDLLAHLPPDVRFRLIEVRVGDGDLYVEGTVPTRSDADALAVAVRDGTGVPVDTPQTQQDGPRAVHFVLTGSTTGENGGGT